MSYCVNCGVELDGTAKFCPLCWTPVCNPRQPVDQNEPTPFPTEPGEVPLAPRRAAAVLLSAMLASVAVCCGLLNLFLQTGHIWSLYVIGAAAMLWVFAVPPLLFRKLPLPVMTLLDGAAIGLYVLMIAWELDGLDWYAHLALPAIVLLGLIMLAQVLLLRNRQRSILSTIALVIASIAVFVVGLELLSDLYFHGAWGPSWSLVVLIVAGAMEIPLLVVRWVPGLRREVRRRFHM